jgi:hypothetical protein
LNEHQQTIPTIELIESQSKANPKLIENQSKCTQVPQPKPIQAIQKHKLKLKFNSVYRVDYQQVITFTKFNNILSYNERSEVQWAQWYKLG